MNPPTKPAEPYPGLGVVHDQAHHAPELDSRHQPDKEAVYDGEKQYGSTPSTGRKIWGMKRKTGFIVFAIVGLIVVGAVVGGAVGATQSSSSNSESGSANPTTPSPVQPTTPLPNGPSSFSTSTSTPTSTESGSTPIATASASATPIAEGEGTYTCPESDNTDFITGSGTGSVTFRQLCDVDWYVGDTAADGSGVDTVEDLTVVLEFSLVDCIEQCAVYSLTHSPPCMAVAYGANVTAAQSRGLGGNCFLKNARGAETRSDPSGQVQAAYMLGD